MITLNSNMPIYQQIVEDLVIQILNGTLKPDDKVPSVRELASQLGVNPNTIQRAYAELERQGFIRTERAVGRYVNDNQTLIDETRTFKINKVAKDFFRDMKKFGLSQEQIQKIVRDFKEEDNE